MTKRANLARHIPTSDAHAAEQATPAAVAALQLACLGIGNGVPPKFMAAVLPTADT